MYQVCLSRDDAAQTGHNSMGSFSLVNDTRFTCNFLKKMHLKNHTVWTLGSVSCDIIRCYEILARMLLDQISPETVKSTVLLSRPHMQTYENMYSACMYVLIHASIIHTCLVPLTYNIHITKSICEYYHVMKPCNELHHGVSPQSGKSVTMAWETVEKYLVPKSNPGQVWVIQEGRTGRHFKQGNLVEGIKHGNVWYIVGKPFQTGNNLYIIHMSDQLQ